jgi:O-antigen/teichoic acid export membrane protein
MGINEKTMFSATLSNYIHLIIKIISSLILVRILFLGMNHETYGFWALLWSIYGYSVLLEFGLGITIQKKTAEYVASNKIKKISSLFSTYLLVYFIISLLIALSTIVISWNLGSFFVINNIDQLYEYSLALLVFGLGSSAAFILGFSVEILRGLYLLKIRNYINTFFIILNAILLWQCIVTDQPLYILALSAVSIQFLNNLAFLFVLKYNIPSLKISHRLVNLADVRNSMQFSLSAYLVMFSNIIIFRTDQIVISVVAGVSYTGLYQIASRVSELFRQFATQFHESIGIKAAMLHATKDKKELSQLMLHSNKIVSAIATFLFVPSFILIEPLLFLWLELQDIQTINSAKILLISMYILVTFRSSMVQILLMNGLHAQLMRIGLFEALSNVVLSIVLVKEYGMIGAALGTLIPNIFLALFYNIPQALKYSSTQLRVYLREYLLPILIALTVTFILATLLQDIIIPNSIVKLFLNGFSILVIFTSFYYLLTFRKKPEIC